MLNLRVAAMLSTVATLVSPACQASKQATHRGLTQPPTVSATDAPTGAEAFAVKWIRVAVPDRGVMLAVVARPSGAAPFPVVILLHGAHGFAPQYVQWAEDLARAGFLAVAGCWFSGGYDNGSNVVAPSIPCRRCRAGRRLARTRKRSSTSTRWCKPRARCPVHAPIGSRSSDTHAAVAKPCNTSSRHATRRPLCFISAARCIGR